MKQLLNQEDINRRAINEWEQALIHAADLLRPFVHTQFGSILKAPDEEWDDMLYGEYIINGAKQSDFDAARVFLDGFDARRKAGKAKV